MARLAIIDWGVGGLGFFKKWKSLRPVESVVYLSDSGYTPYGKLTETELADRLDHIFTFLRSEYSVTHIIIACNAASSVLGRCEAVGVEVQGVIESTVGYVRENINASELTVIGGVRTVESHCYSSLLEEYKVQEIVGQALSAHVEAGETRGGAVEASIRQVLGGLAGEVVLACTHYVALKHRVNTLLPDIQLHDPIPWIAKKLDVEWGEFDGNGDTCLTTGDPILMRTAARRCFRVKLDSIKTCNL